MTNVSFHDLATRQFDNNAPYTTWTCSNQTIIDRVSQAIDNGEFKEGSVEGSMIVPISHSCVYTPVVELKEGQTLQGVYEPRRGTTYSIKSIVAVPMDGQEKIPAQYCEAIVYPNPDNDGTFVIVSVNGSPTEGATPINPLTLLRNYFKIGEEQSHGTTLSWEQLEETLRESVVYWDNKANLG
jgi:hypothetical protein